MGRGHEAGHSRAIAVHVPPRCVVARGDEAGHPRGPPIVVAVVPVVAAGQPGRLGRPLQDVLHALQGGHVAAVPRPEPLLVQALRVVQGRGRHKAGLPVQAVLKVAVPGVQDLPRGAHDGDGPPRERRDEPPVALHPAEGVAVVPVIPAGQAPGHLVGCQALRPGQRRDEPGRPGASPVFVPVPGVVAPLGQAAEDQRFALVDHRRREEIRVARPPPLPVRPVRAVDRRHELGMAGGVAKGVAVLPVVARGGEARELGLPGLGVQDAGQRGHEAEVPRPQPVLVHVVHRVQRGWGRVPHLQGQQAVAVFLRLQDPPAVGRVGHVRWWGCWLGLGLG
mmetsp:Transcript_10544/g.18646  ORF Transcript_10544/g.18646 Transcript_10544/m.18646 type:complete len:336 (+) Transcript_10544:4318-5325(+)